MWVVWGGWEGGSGGREGEGMGVGSETEMNFVGMNAALRRSGRSTDSLLERVVGRADGRWISKERKQHR